VWLLGQQRRTVQNGHRKRGRAATAAAPRRKEFAGSARALASSQDNPGPFFFVLAWCSHWPGQNWRFGDVLGGLTELAARDDLYK